MTRILRFVAPALLLLVALLAAPAAGAAPPKGNSANAKACQQGGYATLVRSDGTAFATEEACTSYAALGGVLQPKPVATITGVTVYATSPYGQTAAVTGTGFLPNTRLTFTIAFAVTDGRTYHGLNSYPYVYTDAAGAFNSGMSRTATVNYISLSCAANTVTVSATDGTNTATGTFATPPCP